LMAVVLGGLLGWGLLGWGVEARAAEPLPTEGAATVTVSEGVPAVFEFVAAEAGGLAVMLRGEDGLDLAAELCDVTGQGVYNGYLDGDWYGDRGWEQGVLPIPRAGVYRLYVDSLEGRGAVSVSTAVVSQPQNELPEDPLGRPDVAAAVEAGEWESGSIRPKRGDRRDWYRLVAPRSGMVTAALRGVGGEDFTLEVFGERDFRVSMIYADGTSGEDAGHESATVDVAEGERLYFRVATWSDVVGGDYRLMVGYVGGLEAE